MNQKPVTEMLKLMQKQLLKSAKEIEELDGQWHAWKE